MHFMSESGQLEFFLLSAETPMKVSQNQATIWGTTPLPPLWSLGYHQCRWNYLSEEELLGVSNNMLKHKLPCDAVWLDIEMTERKKYFTWDKHRFPNPKQMVEQLRQNG